MPKEEQEKRNVSGSFQIVDDNRKQDLKDTKNQPELDEESLYYARIFMED